MLVAEMWMNGWGALVWLAWAAFWVLVVVGIVTLVRGHTDGTPGSAGNSALHVLEERYARGEISREEFFERRSTLATPPATAPSPPPEPDPDGDASTKGEPPPQ